MSFEDDRSRFARPRGLGAGYVRWKMQNYYAGQAHLRRAAGDEAGCAHFAALAEEARTKSRSDGPPVAMADRPARR